MKELLNLRHHVLLGPNASLASKLERHGNTRAMVRNNWTVYIAHGGAKTSSSRTPRFIHSCCHLTFQSNECGTPCIVMHARCHLLSKYKTEMDEIF